MAKTVPCFQQSLPEARKSVFYDVGSDYEPARLTREVWNLASMEPDIQEIATDLHCNAVLLFGIPPDRLADAGHNALRNDLDAWVEPCGRSRKM